MTTRKTGEAIAYAVEAVATARSTPACTGHLVVMSGQSALSAPT
jgi:hypothetical protein